MNFIFEWMTDIRPFGKSTNTVNLESSPKPIPDKRGHII
jgi:hypothetical protein